MEEFKANIETKRENPKSQTEKPKEQTNELKFKMELELVKWWVNDEQFLNNYLKTFHNINLNSYKEEIKTKLIYEIKKIFKEIKLYPISIVQDLREIREWMSFWLEKWKSDDYYRSMILTNKIDKSMIILDNYAKTITSESQEIWWKKIHKEWYQKLTNEITKLNKEYSININQDQIITNKTNLRDAFFEEIIKKLDKNDPKYWEKLQALKSRNPQKLYWQWIHIEITNSKNEKVDILNVKRDYEEKYSDFSSLQNVYENWNKLLKEYKWNWFWFDTIIQSSIWTTKAWTYEKVWHKDLEKLYKEELWKINIDKMWIADLVIMLRIIFLALPLELIPVVGIWLAIPQNITWWMDDIKQAYKQINFDWSVQGIWENVMWYVTWILWITVVWWTFWKLAKWPKLAKAIEMIWKIIDKMKNLWNLKELWQNPKIMSMLEWMSQISPKIKELINKIKQPSWIVRDTLSEKDKYWVLKDNPLDEVRDLKWKKLEKIKKTQDFWKMWLEEVAKLDNKDRIKAWEVFLNKKFNKIQEKAILEAHEIWIERVWSWINNYTPEELRQKAEILKKAWFSLEERRILMQKWICGRIDSFEFLSWIELKDLYERFPILKEYSDVISPWTKVRVIWEWTKWLILDITEWKNVLKFPLEEEAKIKLQFELEKIEKFRNLLEKWYENWYVSKWLKIPKVYAQNFNWKLIYSMERVDWYSLTTLSYIEKYSQKLKEAWLDFRKMTDFEIKESLVQLWVKRLDLDLMNIDYDVLLKKYFPNKVDWFQFALEYLKAKWLIHTDLHSWNVMVWKNWNIYIIDFDAVKINN